MSIILHVVDAFTASPVAGNPAAICLFDSPREDAWMNLVAREMNLSETAFLHRIDGGFSLRWFTHSVEVKLCGHATLNKSVVKSVTEKNGDKIIAIKFSGRTTIIGEARR